MRSQKILIAFIIALFHLPAFSAEKNFSTLIKKELPTHSGTFRTVEFNTPDHQTITLHAVLFNSQYHARFHLQENKIQFFADYLDALSHKNNFIVGINGGFYQPDFTPAGLFVYQGKMIKPLSQSSLFKTCISINKNKKITLETPITQCNKSDNAMQVGPLLIQAGKINSQLLHLSEKMTSMKEFFRPHKRTLLALTDDDHLLMIVTSPVTLIDIARFLQNNPQALGAQKIRLAVNLDGGSSTGMYIRFPDRPFYFHELKHVKTFIFIDQDAPKNK